MWLDKVVQSLIKGPIFTFEASPCFIVPFMVKLDFSSIKVHALLYYGAFACFMDKDFIDRHKLPLVTRKHSILIEVIDGRPLVLGNVIHETTSIYIIIEWHHSIIAFNIIKSPSNPIVLGLFWLDKYNPVIDWKIQRLTFQPRIASIQKSNYGGISSIPCHQQLKSHHGKISKTQVPLVVGTRTFI